MEDHGEGVYDEVEIEDMQFDYDRQVFVYPCPCGDKFFISIVLNAYLFEVTVHLIIKIGRLREQQ